MKVWVVMRIDHVNRSICQGIYSSFKKANEESFRLTKEKPKGSKYSFYAESYAYEVDKMEAGE